MALPLFGVVHDMVRRHHFPTVNAFSSSTKPTDATVTEQIADCAAKLASVLLQKSVDPVALSVDAGATSPIAYQRCQRAIRVGAAAQAMDSTQQKDSPNQVSLRAEFREFMLDVRTNGYLALGDAPAPTESAVGPRDHIDNLGLNTTDPNVTLDVLPPFHKGDMT